MFGVLAALAIFCHSATAYLTLCESDCVDMRVLCYEECDAWGKAGAPEDVLEECTGKCDDKIVDLCKANCDSRDSRRRRVDE